MANIFTRVLDKLKSRQVSPALQEAVTKVLAPVAPTPAKQTVDEMLAELRAEVIGDIRKGFGELRAEQEAQVGKSLDELLAENDPVRKQIEQTFVDSPALEWLLDGEWMYVNSTNVDRIRYFMHDRTLDVQFLSGALYSYQDVPPEIAAGMHSANSKGRYVWNWLRDVYAFRKLAPATRKIPHYPKVKKVVRALNKEEIAQLGVQAVRARNLELIRKKLRL